MKCWLPSSDQFCAVYSIHWWLWLMTVSAKASPLSWGPGDVTEVQVTSGLQRLRVVTVSCGGQAEGTRDTNKHTAAEIIHYTQCYTLVTRPAVVITSTSRFRHRGECRVIRENCAKTSVDNGVRCTQLNWQRGVTLWRLYVAQVGIVCVWSKQ